MHTVLRGLCLSCPWFTRNDDCLFFLSIHHTLKSFPSDHIDMRCSFSLPFQYLFANFLHNLWIKKFFNVPVRINSNESCSNICKDIFLSIALNKILQNAFLSKIWHLAHVIIKILFHYWIYTKSFLLWRINSGKSINKKNRIKAITHIQ